MQRVAPLCALPSAPESLRVCAAAAARDAHAARALDPPFRVPQTDEYGVIGGIVPGRERGPRARRKRRRDDPVRLSRRNRAAVPFSLRRRDTARPDAAEQTARDARGTGRQLAASLESVQA